MNDFQNNLYTNLMHLVATNDAFFFKDFVLENIAYRIFNYRLSSYSDFCLPSALECRGVMFEVVDDVAIRLASMPMEKFFNIGENPFTMDLDFSDNNVVGIMAKMDGSLISTYLHNGNLRLKTKGSLFSDQAVAAMTWLDREENAFFKDVLELYTMAGQTVNLEYTAPTNRIVVGYSTERLTVLNVRDTTTGQYVSRQEVESHRLPKIIDYWVDYVTPVDTASFVSSIPEMQDKIEGFVIELKSGQKVKCKTIAYISLHHTKDSINMPRRLFECVINETSDDLRSLFADDECALGLIKDMEDRVVHRFDGIIKTVEQFYNENKMLSRKDYAIKGQTEDDGLFSLKMNLFLEKANDYKTFAIKHIELFDIHDPDPVIDSE